MHQPRPPGGHRPKLANHERNHIHPSGLKTPLDIRPNHIRKFCLIMPARLLERRPSELRCRNIACDSQTGGGVHHSRSQCRW
jgi:hypothetical protein